MGWNPFKEAVNLVKDVSGFSLAEDLYSGLSGKDAADAAKKAGKTQAGAAMSAAEIGAQSEADKLAYLREANALPQQYRDQALQQLSQTYMPNGPQTREQMIGGLTQDPFYQQMVGQGEEAVLRNASATGGMRGGNVQQGLAQNSQNVLQQLYGQQMAGVQGLAGLNTNTNAIANTMGNIGNIEAQGVYNAGQATGQSNLAAAQAQQQGMGNLINLGLGVGGLMV